MKQIGDNFGKPQSERVKIISEKKSKHKKKLLATKHKSEK